MTKQTAMIIGAIAIGLSITGSQLLHRYVIAPAGDSPPRVWRMDSLTGKIEYCSLGTNKSPNTFDRAAEPFAVTCIASGPK